jgi:hypothetical protein
MNRAHAGKRKCEKSQDGHEHHRLIWLTVSTLLERY